MSSESEFYYTVIDIFLFYFLLPAGAEMEMEELR